ncbi:MULTISPECIES: lytic transglycosylase domain-containing protein [Leptospira]|uniref:Transglycosylase SLT domain protein n=3 Tax=Leptospira borgpetersenii TaxID=174 RepID=M3G9Z2_LEPBO|nr:MULTISPECIES: lytic transglycosylase domain-containing protein [Leptospira]EMF97721.1 transglycosylase SLT domain protein [Leptospira borgpetersenii str. 200701203]EKP11821.1 transglycosylase SLT domain protein [Leptospira borgpetersenii str. 200801926]EMK13635.1 transglycosylase SLT domain protein [Leptospira sp. serovar Kenya str. Sh9]EMN13458.1 transglycosylase SLT domain protein [Leptospira borgpetersenii str. Brem 307]EMN16689.1 transglycosylase SLT domain protein [Leptospira borgpeter
MRIEELPPVQKILNRIQDIESLANRFVKETPAQNRQEPFDSMLKAEGEKSASNPKIEPWRTNSRGNWEGIEPTLAEIIRKESEKNHLDPSLVQSVIKAESGFKTDAISPKGAIGLMQLMPSTANLLGVDDPSDPAENVAGGTKFLSDLLNKYRNLDHALAAYNAGPKAVDHYGGIPPYKETKKYVEKVKKFYRDFSE